MMTFPRIFGNGKYLFWSTRLVLSIQEVVILRP